MKDQLADIEHRILIDAAPSRVWKYLTAPEHVPAWLGCIHYRCEVGHVFYMQQDDQRRARGEIDGATHCRILRIQEPHGFAFSWYLPGTPETRVDITLDVQRSGTEVALIHSGWDEFDPTAVRSIRDALANGWGRSVLPQLKALVQRDGR